MSEWQEKYLYQIADIRISNVDKKIHPDKLTISLCNYMDAYSNRYITSKIPFTTGSADLNQFDKLSLRLDDVIITKDSESADDIGISSVVSEELKNVVCGYHLALLRPNENEFDGTFLMLSLSLPESKKYFFSVANGSTRYGLTIKNIKMAKIKSPPLQMQQVISHIVKNFDHCIEKTEAAIEKYKAIKQGMMHDLFTRGIDIKTGKLRPNYDDAPELYQESPLGWVPHEWEDCKMGKYILNYLYGPRFNAKDYTENGNVKTIRGTDYTKDGIILYQQTPKALLPSVLIKTHKLEDGDILIVTTADCGLTAVFEQPINDIDFIPSAYSVKYRFAANVNPYFIKYFMDTDAAIRQVNIFVRQGTLGNLPGSDILNFEMVYPKKEEQNEIVKLLRTTDNKLQSEQDYLHKQQMIKASLMSDLLSGRKRVKLNEEIFQKIV